MSISAARAAGLALFSLAISSAEARITRIEITQVESPTFGGYEWPNVGKYEKLVGIAHGEVNPHDPRNSVIVDLDLADTGPAWRTAGGNVKYSFNFYILKPIDLSKGAHKVMYEPPNRGGKTWTGLARVSGGGNDPGSITDPAVLGNAFFMPRGYTLVWSGWENDLAALTSLTATGHFPVARNRDGSSITGPSYEYIVSSARAVTLSYAAADYTDKSSAKLTRRVHLDDAPILIEPSRWKYYPNGLPAVDAPGTANDLPAVAGPAIGLVKVDGTEENFTANDIYEFSYTAKDPTVNGLGFAAVRDWNAWLRYATHDDDGTPNPLAGDVQRIYTEVVSQPGRLLNDFRHLGFNESEDGRKVFDGHVQWIAAGNGLNMNYRFSQTGRTERNRQNHLYIEGRFPFANVMSHDPITRSTDSRYKRCQQTNTCPLAMEIYSSNEYWVKSASLLHTDPSGQHDLGDSPYARNYLMSSMQHGSAASPGGVPGTPPLTGACQQPQNPLNSNATQRALWIALDEWSTNHKQPPKSRVPQLKDGTLAPPLPQAGMGFPTIPGVTYTGLKTTRYHFDYGLNFYETGIATINPPVITVLPGTLPSSPTTTYQDNPANGPIYPSFVPTTDADGNEIAGVRLPDLRVPLATYTGWALRSGVWANDGCEASGQFIPFAATEETRAAGDPRPSVKARYPTFAAYHGKVREALNDLVKEGFLLCEDAGSEETRMLRAGFTRGVPGAPATPPTPAVLPACQPDKHAGKHDGKHHD